MAAPARRLTKPVLFICDLQEKFAPVISNYAAVISTTQKLLRASQVLQIPVVATTQLRAKLGATDPALGLDGPGPDGIPTLVHADKSAFSMWTGDVRRAVDDALGPGPRECVVVGIESHICVMQTALDLLGAGHRVYVIVDAVSSCNPEEVPVALARLRAEGVVVVSSESWLYECMGDAGIVEFKAVAGLVKEYNAKTKESLQALCKI